MGQPIPINTLEVVTWVIGGIAIALSGGRYYIRWTSCGFLADDAAHLFALLFMVANFALFTSTIPFVEEYMVAPSLNGFKIFQSIAISSDFLLFLCLWAVKFGFVLLYRTICGLSTALKTLWWSVLVFNVLTLGLCIGSILSLCGGSAAHLLDIEVCADPQYIPLDHILFNTIFAAVLSSDVVTMLLPAGTLFKLKMRPSHRLAVLVAMTVSSISIVFEVFRATGVQNRQLNTLAGNVEIGVAVIVSTFPAYYSLIARWHERRFPTSRKFSSPDAKLKDTVSETSSGTSSPCASPV